VIVGEAAEAMAVATILTTKVVTHRHVDARELDGALPADEYTKQSNDRGHLDGDANRPNVLVVLFDHLDLTVEDHAHGALPADDSVRLITLV
jgi:hypothetical protein